MDIIKLSRELMYKQTIKNKAPAWLLTELAVNKGRELAKKQDVDEDLVVASLYLAHTVFNREWKGEVQKNHPKLSSDFIKPYLKRWKIAENDQKVILNSIEAHHGHAKTESKIAEVVKNAECFKFVTVEGSLILLHELGIRGVKLEEAIDKVLEKAEDKRKLLTLKECKVEAEKNCREISRMFNRLKGGIR